VSGREYSLGRTTTPKTNVPGASKGVFQGWRGPCLGGRSGRRRNRCGKERGDLGGRIDWGGKKRKGNGLFSRRDSQRRKGNYMGGKGRKKIKNPR